jgi:cytosine/adenosine deaminase-related metal-dependent hydrolase
MLLCNLHIIGKKELQNIQVTNGNITAVNNTEEHSISSKRNESQIDFSGAIAFPCLTNSHDHLDFNLFPQTANRIYSNYAEWGRDIHLKNKKSIDVVLRIPEHLRTQWGLYKNLLAGVTTVVNHGKKLSIADEIITVLQNNRCLHSIEFEKGWKLKLNGVFIQSHPFVIHVGEGTDKSAKKEIDELIKWNLFRRKIVGVHGVAMTEKQAGAFEALVWCPVSNFFLLDNTAAIDELKAKTTILFGTDSTLTASWNLWEHLRVARDTLLLTDAELFESLTRAPAVLWKQKDHSSIAVSQQADLVVANANNKTGYDAFYSINPEDIQLILHKGEILLFDEQIKSRLSVADLSTRGFSKVCMKGKVKFVYGDITGLINEILSYYPKAVFPISI